MRAGVRLGIGGLLLVGSCSQGESDKWDLVAPRSNTLPNGEPPASFARRDNIISPLGVSSGLDDRPALLHTNKFYSNLLLDTTSRAAWTLPYIVTINEEHPFGLYVSYPRFFEGERQADRLKWYATTTAKDILLSAKELHTNQEAVMTDFDDEGFSATVKFTSPDAGGGSMTTYLVRGMAYVTALYQDYTPEVATQHAIIRVNGNSAAGGVHTNSRGRFMLELNDGSTWIVYSSNKELELSYVPATSDKLSSLKARFPMTGTLRASRVPYNRESAEYDEAMNTLDEHAGCYPVSGELRAFMHKTLTNRGRYTITWNTAGDESGLLHYALPHQQGMLEASTVTRTGLFLSSPTKGNMELVTGKIWEIKENDLPEFEWVPSLSEITSDVERGWIEYYLEQEIPVPLDNVAGSSVYFGAKNLMAYAQLCLVADEMERDDLVEPCIDQVEAGFDEYLKHSNGNPLVYDKIWGGVVGGLGLEEGSSAADFYASYYNDHHFHYSYVVNVAATLAHLKPKWATSEKIEWVNTLIRDVNDPNKYDAFFPQFRSFDWFSGHSWARGLLFAFDGKDQESTSEDVNFFYAMTMWAIATRNFALEGLGRLQTGVVKRSVNEYFLLKDGNTNHPPDFVKNKVTGIFFESKVDYITWFGANVEYIHGIQNIPVTAMTEYVRDPQFVSEEWHQRLKDVVGSAEGTWNTVLYMSYATIQKHLAFKKILTSGTDDGLLRAWALYWAATRPECSTHCSHDETHLDAAPNSTPTPVVPSPPPGGPTPAPTEPTQTGTFTCDGIQQGEFCCSAGCGQCGGSGCSDRGNGLTGFDCCHKDIVSAARLCSVTRAAPCFLDEINPADKTCPGSIPGISAGDAVCCPLECKQCGGRGCASSGSAAGLGWEECCGSGVKESDIYCDESGKAPCIIGSRPPSVQMCPGDIPGISAEDVVCCPLECNQCGGSGCSNSGLAAGLGWDACCGAGVKEADVYCDESGKAPCIIGSRPPTAQTCPGGIEGISSDDDVVCCPLQCNQCGGSGCSNSGSAAGFAWEECCGDGVKASDIYCDESGKPPCIIGSRPPPPAQMCPGGIEGISAGDTVCCPLKCNQCGGSGCSNSGLATGLGWDECCGSGVKKADVYCDESGKAPCIIGSRPPTGEPPAPSPSPWAAPASSAYQGIPAVIPGLVQAERFDSGGEGFGYSDTSPGNNGGVFRPNEDVDISGGHGNYHVAWIREGEFLRYTVNVEEAASAFNFKFHIATIPQYDESGSFRVVTGGTGCDDFTTDLSGLVTVPSTGGWGSFASLPVSGGGGGGLPVGRATLWLCVISSNFNLDSFAMEAVPMPTPSPTSGAFGGVPANVPGLIQAEDFDVGGEGVAYSDTDPGNNGGAYRTSEAVDISVTGNQEGYHVGWTRPGEFLRYTIYVEKPAAKFHFMFRVAAPIAFHNAGSFRIVAGGTGCDNYTTDLSGPVVVPSTGGWGSFEWLPSPREGASSSKGAGGLPAGPATIWMCIESRGFNIDSFTMSEYLESP